MHIVVNSSNNGTCSSLRNKTIYVTFYQSITLIKVFCICSDGHPPTPPNITISTFSTNTSFILLFFLNKILQPKLPWVCLQPETCQLNQDCNLRESCIFNKQLIIANNFSPSAKHSSSIFASMLGAVLVQTCIAFVYTVTITVSLQVQLHCWVQKTPFGCNYLPPLCLKFLMNYRLQKSLSLGREWCSLYSSFFSTLFSTPWQSYVLLY